MKIMLCGANDIRNLKDTFKRIAVDFGLEPLNYWEGSILHSNYDGWSENSVNSVAGSDILVYTLAKDYGEITWETEFITANRLGKPFIVLCLEETFNSYQTIKKSVNFDSLTDENQKKAFHRLKTLEDEQKTIIPFQYDTFGDILKDQLVNVFRYALSKLGPQIQKSRLSNRLRQKDIGHQHWSHSDIEYLQEISLDVFEHKEIRKRAMTALADIKKLQLGLLKDLVEDHEQGVARLAVQLSVKLNLDEQAQHDLFDFLIDKSARSDDVGLERRACIAMISINPELAAEKLLRLFPCNDVGTPSRIVREYHKLKPNNANKALTNTYKTNLITLMALCAEHKIERPNWKTQAKSIIDDLNNPSSD